MNIGVTGATGRMGGTIISAAPNRDVDVAFAVNRDPVEDKVNGIKIQPAARFDELLETTAVDVVLDFTGPESSVDYSRSAEAAGVPILVGTTGFDEGQMDVLRESATSVPVLHGANFARGVQALIDAVTAALATIPEYDVELTETHHNGKRDAPSGTANVILEHVEGARDQTGEHVHGRVGEQPREDGEIGVHARRAGDITGEHELLIAGNAEALSLTHRAGSRAVFAEGALDAAAWLVMQSPGFYRFADIAEQLT